MLIVKRHKIFDALLIIVIMLLLEYVYKNFVSRYFLSNGFSFTFDAYKYTATKLILILAVFLNILNSKSSYLISSLFISLMLVPNLIIYEFVKGTPFVISFFACLTIVLLWVSNYIGSKNTITTPTVGNKLWLISILGFVLFIPFVYIYKFDINLQTLLFKDIYEVRAAGSSKTGIFTAYTYNWLVKIIFPIALILSIRNRNKIIFIAVLLAQIYLFLVQGHKSVFISIFLIFFYYIKTYARQVRIVLLTIISTISLTHIISLFSQNIVPESILVRRLFFVPALNNNYYFEYFKDKYVFYAHSILKRFIDYPFDKKPQYLIGETYYGNAASSINNGFISDGFLNMGHWGVFINVLLVVLYFKLIVRMNLNPMYSGILIIIIFTLLSSYFFTALLTHGLLLFLLLGAFVLKENK